MTNYKVRISDEAVDELNRLDTIVSARIFKRLEWLRVNVDSIVHLPLTGKLAGSYKLRVGDYRAIYRILRDIQIIVVQSVGHRRDVYRRQ